jgi:hypothetical protein
MEVVFVAASAGDAAGLDEDVDADVDDVVC